MYRMRTLLLLLGATLVAAVAVVVLMANSGSGGDTRTALATNPTPGVPKVIATVLLPPKYLDGKEAVLNIVKEPGKKLEIGDLVGWSGANWMVIGGSQPNNPHGKPLPPLPGGLVAGDLHLHYLDPVCLQASDPALLYEDCKGAGAGSIQGVYDVQVHGGAKVVTLYHCISRFDHNADTNEVKSLAQCYADLDIGDPTAAVPDLPGEGPDIDGDTVPELDGPPPPPPYTAAAPTVFNGFYIPGADVLDVSGCFTNIGGTLGPNIIAHVVVPNANAQLVATGKMQGGLYLYGNMSITQCLAKDIIGHPEPDPLPINLHRVGGGNPVPWRAPGDEDWDDDGCTDFQELDNTGEFKCGDDPFNPHDSNKTDISGSYSMTATAIKADWDKILDELIPGAYYHCLADIQQEGDGKAPDSVAARVLCYIDIPLVPVNPEMGPESGDGLSGASPPEPYADVDDVHTVLVGEINNDKNTLDIEGCFEDRDGMSPLGNVYVRTAMLDVHTGIGLVNIWIAQTTENCLGGTPAGAPVVAHLEMVRQQTKDGPERDTDGDDCPNKNELSDNQQEGGLRDPYNRWDYMNPTRDGQNRVDDILAVVNQYFIDKGQPAYTKLTDRTSLVGGNAWNLGPPNGQQRVDDILASVKSYFHDCDGGTFVDPDDEKAHP